MTNEAQNRVREIFFDALDKAPEERATLLDHACAGDNALREEVEELLHQLECAGSFLDQPLIGRNDTPKTDELPQGGDKSAGTAVGAFDQPTREPVRDRARSGDSTDVGDVRPLPAQQPVGTPDVPGYTVFGELGRGGMGVVYKARQIQANRAVALKMILAQSAADRITVERFRTEAQAIANLQHPNIVQIFDVGEHHGTPYFSLELCTHGSLDQYLAESTIPPKSAALLLAKLCDAIQTAHDAKVIHRDLKPANILFQSPDGGRSSDSPLESLIPKITDFGLAKRLDDATITRTGVVMGTPSYMAPEQAQGKKDVGPQTDVYSLGAVLYQCLTGKPPFKAADSLETILLVINEEPVAPAQLQPNTPRDLDTVCLKCLQKDPTKRYASASEMAADLRRFVNGQPILARPVGRWERAARWCRRHPAVASLLAALFVVFTVGVSLVGWQWRRAATLADTTEQQNKDLKQAQISEKESTAKAFLQLGIERSRQQLVEEGLRWMKDGLAKAQEIDNAHLEQLIRNNIALWRRYHFPQRAKFFHDEWILAAQFSPDNQWIVTSGKGDRTIKVWNRRTRKLAWRSKKLRAPAVSLCITPDSKTLIGACTEIAARPGEGGKDSELVFWNLPTGKRIAKPILQNVPVTRIQLSGDGRTLASFHPRFKVLEYYDGGDVQLWDVRARRRIVADLDSEVPIDTLAFTNDGKSLLTGSVDGMVRI